MNFSSPTGHVYQLIKPFSPLFQRIGLSWTDSLPTTYFSSNEVLAALYAATHTYSLIGRYFSFPPLSYYYSEFVSHLIGGLLFCAFFYPSSILLLSFVLVNAASGNRRKCVVRCAVGLAKYPA